MNLGSRLCFTIALLFWAGQALAAPDPRALARQRIYDSILGDGELYAGEGVVTLKSFGDDLAKAKVSGRERSRANLAEAIRVHIVSKISDLQSMGKGGSQEEVSAQSSSSSDLELEGIEYKYLEDFPKDGQLTVLAYLSKEAYLRQSDHRIFAYRPLRAIRIAGGGQFNLSLNEGLQSPGFGPGQASIYSSGTLGGSPERYNSSSIMALAAEFYWNSWIAGLGFTQGAAGYYTWEPFPSGYAYEKAADNWNLAQFRLGYEWTPWATRLQLAVPLMAEVVHASFDSYSGNGYGVVAGLRLRYWTTDRFAFDIGGLWHQGLSKEDLRKDTGRSMRTRYPDTPVDFSTTGPEFSIGVLWNGI